MKIINVQQNTPEWLLKKRGKIGGSSLGKIFQEKGFLKNDLVLLFDKHNIEYAKNSKGACGETINQLLERITPEIEYELFVQMDKKRGFYKVMAEKLFRPKTEEEENEDARDRGHRLEDQACERFTKETGIKVSREVGMIESDENKDMIVSPDGVVFNKKIITEAVETKNFEDAHHVEAIDTGRVPSDIWPQVIQYFIVIETLEKLHLVFHSDRTIHQSLQYFCITIERKNIEEEIERYKRFELNALRYMQEFVEKHAF